MMKKYGQADVMCAIVHNFVEHQDNKESCV